MAAAASPTPSPAATQAVDPSELFATLIAFIVVLGLSILLIARMRAANR
jgi:hypothetical protein